MSHSRAALSLSAAIQDILVFVGQLIAYAIIHSPGPSYGYVAHGPHYLNMRSDLARRCDFLHLMFPYSLGEESILDSLFFLDMINPYYFRFDLILFNGGDGPW